jgi:signal transduction histidine kinase
MSESTLSKLLVIPTAIVAVILGVLLYRWSNQVSEATSVRLADSLQMSMANWHLNLYRDLSDVAGALRVDSENSSNLVLYARRFREWRSTAQYRDVVSNLFVLKSGDESPPLCLDLDEYTFKPADLSESLKQLRPQLAAIAVTSNSRAASSFPRGLAGWEFESNPLVLVRPIDALPGSWLIIELDEQVIQSRILPDLAKRYFMGVDGLDYLIAVVSGSEPRQVIYSSDPGFGEGEVADADGRMDVFGNATMKSFGSPLYVFHQLSENARLAGIPGTIGTQWFPLLKDNDESGWQLIVRHRRGGALGAFVAEMHRRDLAISFGVLFLLIAMVSVLIVTSLRANRLAKLQMDFVTAVSHELRSPLTIIGSAAENITHGVVTTKEQIDQYGRVIESQTRQLSRLVEDVLLFAATREDRHRYTSRSLEVSEIVEATLAATDDLIKAAEFVVDRDVQPNLPKVRGDLGAISQCLQNLITNALKYSGDRKWIGITASAYEDNAGNR